ncbi:ATP-binding protein [Candidatus Magnetominusculus dajiuhuensis]|uniref:PAS domain-containing sensor histidine kinase n=1 Tax=Candidatus Magnetominusculus dajiuhuensis TaxID=3137712 RepID=UPI003B43BF3E
MASLILSLVSVIVQAVAVYMALRLIRVTKNSSAWVFISVAISLMTLRRLENLYKVTFDSGVVNPVGFEVLGLVISIFMLAGVVRIAPIFLSIKTSHDKIQESLSEKEILLGELGQTKQLLEAVANGITEEILLIAEDFKVLWANDAVIRAHKVQHNQIIGMHCHKLTHHLDVSCEPPDDPCPITVCKATGQAAVVHHTHIMDDGSSAFLEISVYPILNMDGVAERFVHVSKDITERVRQEEKIRNLNIILEQKVKEEVSLREQERQLLFQQSKMAAVGEMIAAIAHQWRQPLNAISIISQEIRDAYECGEMTNEYMKEMVDVIIKQISFMSKTINDFRNFLNPSKDVTTFSIKESIEEILSMFKDILSKSNIAVTLEEDSLSEKCAVMGYPNEFKHVVLNIINNSRDAISSMWEKDLLDKEIGGKIIIRLSGYEGKVLVSVIDNGGGVPDEFIDKIFNSHFTTKSAEKGTGIGLYISKTIIEGMGGTLTVRNTDGGAEFTISLDAIE